MGQIAASQRLRLSVVYYGAPHLSLCCQRRHEHMCLSTDASVSPCTYGTFTALAHTLFVADSPTRGIVSWQTGALQVRQACSCIYPERGVLSIFVSEDYVWACVTICPYYWQARVKAVPTRATSLCSTLTTSSAVEPLREHDLHDFGNPVYRHDQTAAASLGTSCSTEM